MATPLPVIVLTGALGVGKTTAIATALSAKPPAERWVVILNEFTDSGIDVLTVAGAAQGEFDVRLVAGGCLCCVGAEDYGRALEGYVRGPRPARLYIEPSGLGDPALIVEELLGYQARGEVELLAVVALVDAARLELVRAPGIARDQVDVADVVLLAKADRASDADRARFLEYARELYPPRRYVGECRDGRLPEQIGAGGGRAPAAGPTYRPAAGPAPARYAPAPRVAHRADRDAQGWVFGPELAFDEDRLVAALRGAPELAEVERFKGVFRVAPGAWVLVQRAGAEVSVRASAWRRDNRVELLARAGARLDRVALGEFWAALAARPGADQR